MTVGKLSMAIASGRAGRVLAQPLFCRLNVHMPTLNTREVVRIRTSKPSHMGIKTAAYHHENFTDKKVTL